MEPTHKSPYDSPYISVDKRVYNVISTVIYSVIYTVIYTVIYKYMAVNNSWTKQLDNVDRLKRIEEYRIEHAKGPFHSSYIYIE